MSSRRAVLVVFVLSGAAGLIYEVVWARQLVLVFGNTTQAVSAILTGFFAGMALGSWYGGRLADRVRSPLRLYGFIEIVLVVVVLLTPVTFRLIHEVYRGAFPALESAPQVLALVRFALALVALGPATILMGATLPALTRYLARSDASLSGAFGRLYAANTIGAVAGTLAAGLVLIELLGLAGTLAIGAACSAVAGVVALVIARSRPDATAAEPTPSASRGEAESSEQPPNALRLALMVSFVSGLTSLGYQVLWMRLLSSGTGNSTYVFTMILAVFLAGIAVGAIIYSLIRPRIRRPIALVVLAQLAVAVLVVAGLFLVIQQPSDLDPGRPLDTLRVLSGSVLLAVLPATVVMGISLPASSGLIGGSERVGSKAGALLAANTSGAIVGTFVVPFVAIPLVGSSATVALLALVNAATAVLLAVFAMEHRTSRTVIAGAGIVVAVTIGGSLIRDDVLVDPSVANIRDEGGTVLSSAEDEIASVQAGRIFSAPLLWVTGTSMTALTVDARLMPILPLIARPAAQRVAIVGFGMGSSYRSAIIAGLLTDAVELAPSVPRMFTHFYPDAEAIRADPRGRVIIADGRNYLELTDRRYDIIVTDPPPPIESSGASVISSREYYQAGRARLTQGGIMMQWVPAGQSEADLRAHIRTFDDVFPHVLIVRGPARFGVFMLGSDAPVALDPAAIRSILARPGVVEDLSSAYDSPVRTLDSWAELIPQLSWLEGDGVGAYAGAGPMITDDRPVSEYFLLRRLQGRDP